MSRNINFNCAFKKTKAGNYFGYCRGYYVFIYKRPHGKWCCRIGRKGERLWQEGYLSTSLPKLQDAKQWAKFKIVPSCKEPYRI